MGNENKEQNEDNAQTAGGDSVQTVVSVKKCDLPTLIQAWKADLLRSRQDLKEIDGMTVEKFETEYNGMSLEAAREHQQGRICAYVSIIGDAESIIS